MVLPAFCAENAGQTMLFTMFGDEKCVFYTVWRVRMNMGKAWFLRCLALRGSAVWKKRVLCTDTANTIIYSVWRVRMNM